MLFNIGEILNKRYKTVNGSFKISLEEAKQELMISHASLQMGYDFIELGTYPSKDIEEYVDKSKSSRVLRTLHLAYDYAIDGDPGPEEDYMLDLGMAISAAGPLRYHMGISVSEDHLLNIAALCTIRSELDEQCDRGYYEYLWGSDKPGKDEFTLFQISLLARMTEKAVRNATQPTAKDRLITYKKGGRTLVTAKDADDWLSRRRGYKPSLQL